MNDKNVNAPAVPDIFKNPKTQVPPAQPIAPKIFKSPSKLDPTPAKPVKAYKKTPPKSGKDFYCFHSEQTPDPYRALQKMDDQNVKLWIKYQDKLRNEFCNPQDEIRNLMKILEKDWFDIKPDYNSFAYAAMGLSFGKENGEKRLNDHLYIWRAESENSATLTRRDRAAKTETVIFDSKNYRFHESYAEAKDIYISPDERYIFCNFYVPARKEKVARLIIIDKPDVIRRLPKDAELKAWSPNGQGLYYTRSFLKDKSCYFYDAEQGTSKTIFSFDDKAKSDASSFLSFDAFTISNNCLRMDVSYEDKYKKYKRYFITHPGNPEKLLEIPGFALNRYGFPKVLCVHDGWIYVAIEKIYSKMDIKRLHLQNPDWQTSETVKFDLPIEKIKDVKMYEDKICAIEKENLCDVLRIYSGTGALLFTFKPETESSINFYSYPSKDGFVEININNYFCPSETYSLNFKTFQMTLLKRLDSPEWLNDLTLTRHFARSKDGTSIPMTLIHKKDLKPDTETPVILYGYGGFGVTQTPAFYNDRLWWTRQGGIYAIAHLRGDGGWTDGWAEAGSRLNKQNTLDDFISCAEYLIGQNMTSPQKLAALGASQGGMTVTASMLQRPDLFASVVGLIPVTDMLDHAMGNYRGSRGNWINDYGVPEILEDYLVLKSYSPLHNIDETRTYPKILMMAMGKDRRAHPGNALKFTATMQDKKGEGSAYLYCRLDGDHHDIFTNDKDQKTPHYEEYAIMYAFIAKTLGISFQ